MVSEVGIKYRMWEKVKFDFLSFLLYNINI
nr:MAG TPA: hypothetical protein [Caudoviricetes sp.]